MCFIPPAFESLKVKVRKALLTKGGWLLGGGCRRNPQ